MDARSTLRPGKKGTKKLVARFGDRLICVRYRYDARRRKRFTTVELIVEEADWTPPDLAPQFPAPALDTPQRVASQPRALDRVAPDPTARERDVPELAVAEPRVPEHAAIEHVAIERTATQPAAADRILVGLKVRVQEGNLQLKVKAAGGKWDKARQLWLLSLASARALGLEHRIRAPDPVRESGQPDPRCVR